MHMQVVCGMHLGVRQLQTIMMYIYSWICCYWRISLRNSEELAWFSTVLILYYYTTPGLASNAALHMSRVELELITDENIYNLIENSIRGGISMIATHYARANNPSFPSTCDDKLPRQDLIYLDANNLYGCAMSQFLPTHGF